MSLVNLSFATMEFIKCIIRIHKRTGQWDNRRKLSLQIINVSLFVCSIIVPAAVCDTGMPGALTYEQIYNTTSYAQLAYHLRPNNLTKGGYNHQSGWSEEFKSRDKHDANNKEQLLVGFARDPFRLSIPEADYLKGVRSIDPLQYSSKDRGKRGVVHLYNMLTCATGCDPIAYKGYGCYCGLLGEGRPTDGIDNCCRLHDECYEHVHCPFYTVYFQPYYWVCHRGQPLCARENRLSRGRAVNGCAASLCDCDRRFAMCVRRYACPRGKALCRSSPLRLLQNILMAR